MNNRKLLAVMLVIMLLFAFTTPAFADGDPTPTPSGSSSASWSGYGSFTTSDSLEKLDSGTGYRYKWSSPIQYKMPWLQNGTVSIQPVNANNVSMGAPITRTSPVNNYTNMYLTNVNYMHIHLRISASSSSVYTKGYWNGTYYIHYT